MTATAQNDILKALSETVYPVALALHSLGKNVPASSSANDSIKNVINNIPPEEVSMGYTIKADIRHRFPFASIDVRMAAPSGFYYEAQYNIDIEQNFVSFEQIFFTLGNYDAYYSFNGMRMFHSLPPDFYWPLDAIYAQDDYVSRKFENVLMNFSIDHLASLYENILFPAIKRHLKL